MDVPQPEPITIDRMRVMLADQMLTIDQQAQYAQTLIAWGTAAHDKVAELEARLARTNGVKERVK